MDPEIVRAGVELVISAVSLGANRSLAVERYLKSVALSSSCAFDARVKRSHPGALRGIIASNMRRIRADKGLTQDAVADLCDLDRTYIGSIERGQRNLTIDTLERLSLGLGVEPWQIVKRGGLGD